MPENEIGKIVVNECIQLHRAPGPGLLEIVYGMTLARRLEIALCLGASVRKSEFPQGGIQLPSHFVGAMLPGPAQIQGQLGQ